MTTQFENVYHGTGKALGKIRFSSAGLGWKPHDEGATVTIPADQIVSFAWCRYVARLLTQCRAQLSAQDRAQGRRERRCIARSDV